MSTLEQQIKERLKDLSWADVVKLVSQAVQEDGEWAGAPVPVEDAKLILESRYPYQRLHGSYIEENGEIVFGNEKENSLIEFQQTDYDFILVRNRFFCHARNSLITIYENIRTGKFSYDKEYQGAAKRIGNMLKTMSVGKTIWNLEAELKALQKLKYHLTDRLHMFKAYVFTGMFLEQSPRSKVYYIFRKLQPTLALTVCPKTEQMKVLASLCMHPIGYYDQTHAGVMVPTDDIIAHLLMMRGDERRFWAKCNQNPIWSEYANV